MSDESGFFEGTEKKVELIVDPSLPAFRDRGETFWREIVRYAHAEVLSSISNEACDAYLLSESSLFVWDHKMVMITCGRTQLDGAVLRLLEDIPPGQVRMLVYERKNEVFPHEQPTSFAADVRRLHRRLPGRAYRFGEEDEHHLMLFHLDRELEPDPGDATLEILMYGLDDEVRARFGAGASAGPDGALRTTGLDAIVAGFTVDDHVFQPGGYSMNAIRGAQYSTVHVTPEARASYASFETNACPAEEQPAMVARVLEVFRPRACDVISFDSRPAVAEPVEGFRLKTDVAADLDIGYGVRFRHFYRPRPLHAATRIPID